MGDENIDGFDEAFPDCRNPSLGSNAKVIIYHFAELYNIRGKRLADVATRIVPVSEYLEGVKTGNAAVQDAFLQGLFLTSGVSKMTHAHRMDDLLPDIVNQAKTVNQRPLKILDVACSSGVSTLEMHQAFARRRSV